MNTSSPGDKIVEWEVTMRCNYRCSYCTNLDPSIIPVSDLSLIRDFIQRLGTEHPGVEIFVFGGEPFLHPDIDYIVRTFNEFEIPFVIQTNFSKKSVAVMKRIKEPFNINISIHPSEVKLDTVVDLFSSPLPANITIKIIDVMYIGRESITYYLNIQGTGAKYASMYLTPVTDFGDGVSGKKLAEYNEKRTNRLLSQIINFESVKEFGEYRSVLWASKEFTTKGKPCIYTDRYFLYGPDFKLHNCCYREVHTGLCNQVKCFLM